MSRRDIELVTALAEGSLVDETEARALIEKSPRLRAVYEEQSRALQALSAIPADALSETEKAALRRDVWTAFTTTNTPLPAKTPMARWAWGYAAVFVFALVGLVTVLNSGSFDTSTESASGGFGNDISDNLGGESTGLTTIPSSAELRQAEVFSRWADSAREGRTEYWQALTVDEGTVEGAPPTESCLDDPIIDQALDNYERVDLIEQEGTLFAIWKLRDTAFGDHPEVVIVDLDECEVAYRD